VGSLGNWVNLANNALVDYTSLDYVYYLQSKMIDQETGQPIVVEGRDLLVMPAKRALMEKILSDTQVRQGSAASTTVVGQPLGYGKNPIAGRFNTPMCSQYAYKRLIDVKSDTTEQGLVSRINEQLTGTTYADEDDDVISADGITLANNFWYAGDFKKAFLYIENLPLTVVRAAPTSYEMADRGLVFSMFIDEMGIPAVREPRYVIRNQSIAATNTTWTNT
jgi:hypothetical protein